MSNGDLVATGSFAMAGGVNATGIVRLSPPCPATSSTFAPGCPSSGGNTTLVASSLPWAGGSYNTEGTNLPTIAIVANVTGFSVLTPSLPLSVAFAQAQAGCDLHVSPDLVDGLLTTTGTVTIPVALPNNPSVLGATLYQQLVALELGGLGDIADVSSSNAISLTIGGY